MHYDKEYNLPYRLFLHLCHLFQEALEDLEERCCQHFLELNLFLLDLEDLYDQVDLFLLYLPK